MNKSKFIKNSITYFLGNVLTKVLTFFLIPIYTNYLPTEDYGYYDLSVSIITLAIPIVFFQIWDAIFRFIYDYKEEKDKQKIVTNGMFVSVIGIIIYGIIIFITQLFVQIDFTISIFLYGVAIGLQYIYGTIARTHEKNRLYMVSGVVNTAVNLTLNIVLITIFKLGVVSLYISHVVGTLVQILMIEFKLKPIKNIRIKDISKDTIKTMTKFSMPIAVATISTWLLTGYARIMISYSLGMSYNGIFAIATRFSTVITLVVSVLQMSWQEISFSVANKNDKNDLYKNGLNKFFNMMVCTTILMITAIQVVFEYLVSKDYQEAFNIMPIICLYTACNSFAGFLSTQFWAEKNSKITSYTVFISAIVNVILIQLLIGKLQLLGVAISLFVSSIISMLIRMYLLDKKYKITINKKYVLLSAILLTIYVAIYYTNLKWINIIACLIAGIISLLIFKNDIVMIINKILGFVKEKKHDT